MRWRFRHVFVDEMQDVNPAQFRFLMGVVGDAPDLFVVGDPNQSVYGWNGADPELLQQLPERWPGTTVVRLDENHRSSPQIVAVAAAALGVGRPGMPGPSSARPDGPVPKVTAHATDTEESAWVAHEAWVAHRPGRRWSHLAVLARTNGQLATVAQAFDKGRIPYHLAGGELGPGSDVVAGGPAEDHHRPALSVASAPETDQSPGGPDDGVVLATFHRAKGLQWPVVFVIGLADGLVPISWATTPDALDEERRLLYVALTRAEDELFCSWSLYRDARLAGTGWRPRRPSPWVAAIEEAGSHLAQADDPPDPGSVTAHLRELRARLDPGGLVGR